MRVVVDSIAHFMEIFLWSMHEALFGLLIVLLSEVGHSTQQSGPRERPTLPLADLCFGERSVEGFQGLFELFVPGLKLLRGYTAAVAV